MSQSFAVRLIGFITLCCLLVSCERKTQVAKANEDGILIVGNAAEPKALDPHVVTGVIESKVITSLFEGLVADHPSKDDEMVPGAALSWKHNEDFTENPMLELFQAPTKKRKKAWKGIIRSANKMQKEVMDA